MPARENLARKNLIVNEDEVRALKRALNSPTDSEAVRTAVRERLAAEEALAALGRIHARRGIDDVFRRSKPRPRRTRR